MPWYSVFIFIFSLEPTVKEQLDENDFRQYYVTFFESNILKLFDHSCIQSSFAKITRHFNKGIWNDTLRLKILRTSTTIWTNVFFSKYFWRTIAEGTWKIIIYTIIRACSLKNIAPRHFTNFCMVLFLSNKPSL